MTILTSDRANLEKEEQLHVMILPQKICLLRFWLTLCKDVSCDFNNILEPRC